MIDPELQLTNRERRAAFLNAVRPRYSVVASLYEAARELAEQGTFPARAVLLAHAVRELRNRLPDAFAAPTRKRLEYHDRFKDIRTLWLPVADRLPGPSSMASSVEVPLEAARAVWRLLQEDAEVGAHMKARFLHMCSVASGEAIPWKGNEFLAEQWASINVEGIAHGDLSNKADERALRAFNALESIVLKLFEYAPQRDARLKRLASEATPTNVLEHLRELFTLHDFDIYFGALANPAVFDILKQAKVFDLNEDELNYWPAATYLQHVVEAKAADVAALLSSLKPTTPGITRQLLLLALAMSNVSFTKVMRKARGSEFGPPQRFSSR